MLALFLSPPEASEYKPSAPIYKALENSSATGRIGENLVIKDVF